MKKTPQPQIRSQPRRIAARAFAAILLLTQAVVANAWGDGGDAISATVELPLDWPLGCENTDDNIQDIIEQMADLGYGVDTGEIRPYEVEILNDDSVRPLRKIDGIHIPFAERNSMYFVAEFGDGKPLISLRPRDVILIRACTPPGPNYSQMSFNAFLVNSVQGWDEGGYEMSVPLQASLTDPLWLEDLLVEEDSEGDSSIFQAPYDRKFNLAFTADRQSFLDVKTAFENANQGPTNPFALPGELIDYSIDPATSLPRNQLAVFIKWDRLEEFHPDAYKLQPGYYIEPNWSAQSFPFYRFYTDHDDFVDAFPLDLRKTKPPRWQKDLAKSYRKEFKLLVEQVIDQYEMQGLELVSDSEFQSQGAFVEGQSVFNAEHGAYCVENNAGCQFDSYSDNYWWDQTAHLLSDEDIYVVVGVDHEKLGMAQGRSYLGIFDLEGEGGLPLKEVDRWTGSELGWSTVDEAIDLPDASLESVAQISFLVELTRPDNCLQANDRAHALRCLGTDELADNDAFVFRGRTSMNPETGTRPSNSQLIAWRLLHFRK